MLDVLYKLVMGPLELIFDIIYTRAWHLVKNPGLAIVFLSLAINFLVLPLYRRADAIQQEEREQSLRMKPGIDHIKKVFRGDERYMILQTYYRQNHYKPWYALKSSLSLLLQIPFFIAAYRYLSGLQLIQGVGFGPIADLGAPDGLLTIGGWTVNLLPVLMTAVNVISGMIYTRGMPLKSKLQLYGMAAVFLVLLYRSPSGLVFYWTLNNLFSLGKNLFYRLKHPKTALRVLCAAAGIALAVFLLAVHPVKGGRRIAMVVLAALALQAPLLMGLYRKNHPKKHAPRPAGRTEKITFWACCLLLTILLGALIPSAIVNASPEEFLTTFHGTPLHYLESSVILAAGTFLIWCGIFFQLASPTGKRAFAFCMAFGALAAAADYMFFGGTYGNMSALIQYDLNFKVTTAETLKNLGVLAALGGCVAFLWRKKAGIVQAVCIAGCVAVGTMSVMNVTSISAQTASIEEYAAQDVSQLSIPLDKKGKNVVVIMLDRAISAYVPFLMAEKPELQAQFDGFTWYPNSLAYGAYTNVGTPALFGGYEYTPEEMNRRSDLLLKEKQNEALKIMPLNFLDSGFEVSVFDPSYANYKGTPDLSIYSDYPQIHAYNIHTVGLLRENRLASEERAEEIRNRNLFCYSLMRAAPVVAQPWIYDKGAYNEAASYTSEAAEKGGAENEEEAASTQKVKNVSKAEGISSAFMDNYSELQALPRLTKITADGRNTFLMMTNKTTHDPMLLKEPEYEPAQVVNNSKYDKAHKVRVSLEGKELSLTEENQMKHYHVNMAAFLQLGKWFDYLRENGLYDNTRIILVSDHGRYMNLFGLQMDDSGNHFADILMYNALLMVKDFGSSGFNIDYTFMTHSDTPTLAFRDLVENPVNPFTGNPITDEAKQAPEQKALYTNWRISENKGYTFSATEGFTAGGEPWGIYWLTLRNQNIFDVSNWSIEQEIAEANP